MCETDMYGNYAYFVNCVKMQTCALHALNIQGIISEVSYHLCEVAVGLYLRLNLHTLESLDVNLSICIRYGFRLTTKKSISKVSNY